MLRPFHEDDAPAFSKALELAFASETATTQLWWDIAGRENLRVWAPDGDVLGGLVDIPMGLFVGGRRVMNHGVAGVAIHPRARGGGHGKRMMRAYVRDLHDRGVAISSLYASTRTLYRRVGYGLAGSRFLASFDTRLLRGAGQRAAWRPAEEGDPERLEAARQVWVHEETGRTDRGPYLWTRALAYRGKANSVFVLDDADGELRAWLAFKLSRGDDGFLTVQVQDYEARDHDGLLAIIGFLGDYASIARKVEIACSPHATLLDALPEHIADMHLYEPYLIRITHLEAALTERGWPTGLSVELDLDFADEDLPEQAGRWRLTIDGGEARVERGGDGTIRLGPRGLAGLYAGYASPRALMMRGLVEASTEERAKLQAAFAGPVPGMHDGF